LSKVDVVDEFGHITMMGASGTFVYRRPTSQAFEQRYAESRCYHLDCE